MGNADLRWLLKDAWQGLARRIGNARPTSFTPPAVPRRAVFEEVEARLLYSADLAPGLADNLAQSANVSYLESSDTTATQVTNQSTAGSLAFEQNLGQTDSQVDFLARGNGYVTYLSDGNATIDLRQGNNGNVVKLNLVDANSPGSISAQDELASKSNYLVGDQANWRTDIANFGAVTYRDVYQGVDVRYYGNQQQLEYDFNVAAGADYHQIGLSFAGVQNIAVADNGDLILTLDGDGSQTIHFFAPVTYQQTANGRQDVSSRYVVHDDGTVGFELGDYDHSLALVIDPTLSYASYLGGSGTEQINDSAVDSAGNLYVVGTTTSTNFPTTAGVVSTAAPGGTSDAFVVKYNSSGVVQYSTYIGGTNTDTGLGIAVDSSGFAYIVGQTQSTDLSIVNGADTVRDGTVDGYLVKLNAAGTSVLYSTYGVDGGGGDSYNDVAVFGTGNAFVTGGVGTSTNHDVIIAKYLTTSSGAASLVDSQTYDGGTNDDFGTAITVDSSGRVYIAGVTSGAYSSLPTNKGDSTFGGVTDGFVMRLTTGLTWDYFSYVGGSGADTANTIALDSSNNVFVGGNTASSSGVATVGDTTLTSTSAGYVAKFNAAATGTATWVTYFEGSAGTTTTVDGIVIDSSTGGVVITGSTTGGLTTSADALDSSYGGSTDAYLAIIASAGTSTTYASYFGGTAADAGLAVSADGNRNVYVAGYTSSDSITTGGASDTTRSGQDGFIAKFSINVAPVITSNGGGASASVNVLENSTAVTTVTATDADGDTLIYSISGGADAAKFTINSSTGALSFLSAPNFESPTDSGGNNVYDVTVQVSDGSLTDTQAIAVTVTNVNEAPVITSNGGGTSASTSVAENSTAVTTVTTTDVDASTTLTYSISGGADAAKFTINSSTGVLTFLSAPNFESPTDSGGNNIYDVTVQVSDGSLTDTQAIAVTVTNVNEAPVITSNSGGASASTNVAENSTAVTTVTATDVDASTTLTYSISGGADAAKFTINSATGALSFLSAPNFESPTDSGGNNIYDVTVQVSDGSLTDTQAIAVTVTNVNEAPVITSNGGGTSASVNTAENSTAVATVTATDVDASTTLTYSISGGADAAKFTINSSTGVLTFLSAPNFESPTDSGGNNIYDVVVQVSDGALTDTQAIAVTVTNVNEAPVITSNGGGTSASTSTAENSSAVTTVTATDVDASTTLTYSISGGADAAKFTINSSTGVLTFLSAPDFETPTDVGGNNVYDVTVQVSDGSLTDTQAIAVTVTNVNEPPNGADKTVTTNEDTAYTFTAGDFGFSDVDAGDTMSAVRIDSVPVAGSLTLSGVAVTAAQVITTANIGNLVFTPAANANGAAYGSFTFSVRDQSSTYDTSSNTITVNVTAVNDAPTGANKTITTNEDTAYTFTAADFGFSDVDTGDTISAVRVDGVPGAGSLKLSGVSVTAGQVITTANIGNLVFTPAANANGTGYTSFTFSVRDQSLAYDAAPNTITFNVTAINDAPVNGVPGAQATDEDTALVFSSGNGNLISISDVDASSSSMQVTLSVSHGTLTLSGITGLSFSSGDGTADASMVFTGTVSSINTALAGLSYLPGSNYNGPDTLSITTNDQGNTGSGGAKSDTDNISVTVNPINDSPVNSVPGAQTVNEDTVLAISTISVNDTDNNLVSVALGVLHGTLNISLSGAASITAGANGTAALTITGVQADINATLTSLTYQGVLNYNGSDTLSVLSTDSDGATDSDTVGITVNAVNDAPVNSVPGAQATNEDTALVFSAGNGNQVQISDVDAASGSLQVTLSVTNGTLSLAGTTGLSFSSGDGTTDASMIFTGTLANINAALATLTYNPTANYNGSATLTIVTSDQGNTGSGGTKSDTDNVAITVNAVNDAPVLTTTGTTLSYTENAAATAIDTGLTVSDIDSTNLSSATVQITGNYQNGQDVLAFTNQLGITGSWNAATATLTLSGSSSVANYQTALRAVTYRDTSDNPVTTTRTVSFTVNDGALNSNTATRNISLTAVNDAPVNSVPGAQAVDEDDVLVFSAGNGNQIQISDIDAAGNSMQITLSVTHGNLTLAGTTGLSFTTGDGTADSTMVFTGTVANINAALASLTFNPTANYNGAATLTLTTNDQGNTGSGGAKSDTDNVSITINAIDDAPVANDDSASTAPGVPIDVDVKANDIDIDNIAADLTVTILSNSPGTSATVNPDGTINFDPGATTGLQTVTYQLTDPDGLQSGTATLTINVAANNLPTSSDASATFDEDTSYSFQVSDFAFSDADGGQTLAGVRIDTLPVAGTLTLSGVAVTAGQTITTANITNLLFTPAANANGTPYATFNFSVQDSFGGYDAAPNTFTLNVDAVNDAPLNNLPAAQNMNEDNSLTLSSGNGNAISIADIDVGGGDLQITLSVTNGALSLSGISGLSFTTGDGSADTTMVFTGTLANINTALNGLVFAPTANFNGTATLTLTTNDQSNTGSGGAKSDTDNLTITVDAVNDAPVVATTGSTLAYTENGGTAIVDGALTVNDIDSANLNGATIAISGNYQSSQDVLAFADQNGISGSWNAGTGVLTLSGSASRADYETALGSVTYLNTSDAPSAATRTVSFTVSDGSLDSNTATRDISVARTNDAPVATIAQPSYSATEQTSLSLEGTGLSVSDVDAVAGSMTATLSVVSGTLTVAAGSTGVVVGGSGTSSVTLTGTLTQINNLLAGSGAADVTYLINSDAPPATDTLTLAVDDNGNTGTGGSLTDSKNVTINIAAVNDAPTNTVPGAQSVAEQASLVFSSGNGNLISVADADAAGGNLQVTLSVGHGSLTLSGTTGLSFTTGDGTADTTLVFTGTVANINAALAGMSYTGDINFNGADTLSLLTSDLGNTGSGGTLTDSDTVAITITAVNDAPVATIAQPSYSATEQTSLSLEGTGLSVSDVDAVAGSMTATLSVVSGTLTVAAGSTGVVVGGSGTSSVTLTGTLTQINNLLAGSGAADVTYLINSDAPPATDTLTLAVDDNGNTGTGGSLTDSKNVTINIAAVNDAPTNTVPGAQSVAEQASLVFSSGNGNLISVADADAAGGNLQVTLSVGHGSLTLSGTTGLSFTTGDGTADTTLVFTGTVANINAALAGMSYTGDINFNGADTLSLLTSDLGNTGSGGTLTDSDTVAITITAVNDAPVATIAQPSYSATEQTSLSLEGTGLSVSDVDAVAGSMTATLSVVSGTLTVAAGSTGVVVGGSGTSSVTLTGTLTQINNLLAGSGAADVTYLINSDAPPATDTLTLAVDDNGNTGTGGSLTDSKNVTINITAVDDAPVITSNGGGSSAAVSIAENTTAVTTVTANDLEGDTLTYSVGGTDAASFTIDTSTGVLTFNTAPDFESPADADGNNVYDITVTVSDGTTSDTQTLILTVTDVNEFSVGPISDADIGANTIAENAANGSAVGITASASDADGTNSIISYSLSNDAGGRFAIDSTTGIVTVADGSLLDYESATSHNITVLATSADGSSSTQGFTINITNVNDNPPVITSDGGGSSASISVTENAVAVTTVTATDADGNTPSYAIIGGADATLFTIDSSTGALVFKVAPDFEAPTDADGDNVYDIIVQASDGSFTDTQAIAITVTNTSDSPPVITSNGGGASAAISIAENGTAVTTVTASDPDLPAPTLTYSLSGVDAARFTIDGTTGVLSFLSAPDFESPADAGGNNIYDIIVQVSDGGLTDTQNLSVTVTNVNEAPSGTDKTITLNEDAPYAFTVADVGFTDVDAGDTLGAVRIDTLPLNGTLTLSGVPVTAGQVITAYGSLVFTPAANANGAGYASMTFSVRDSNGAFDVSPNTIIFDVTPVNDAPTGADQTVTIAENTPHTFAASDFGFTDVDTADSLSAVRVDTVPGAGSLTLSGVAVTAGQVITTANIGNLVFTPAANANGLNYASFTFSVRDQGGAFDTTPNTITVDVTAVNNAPVITSSGGGGSAAISVAENTSAVTTVAATDVDGDALTYTISGGADASRFVINATTGALSFVAAPNFELPGDAGADNVYDIIVQVSDGTLTDTQAIAVTVTNVNETPSGTDKTIALNENTSYAFTAADVGFADVDAGDTLSAVRIDALPLNGALTLSGVAVTAGQVITTANIGNLVFTPATNASGLNYASFTFSVRDQSNAFDASPNTITVNVTPVNNAPVITSSGGGGSAALSITENTAAVTTVTANDVDGDTLTYTINGGADASRFIINATTGALSFVAAPNFELPGDAGADNVYDVIVQVSDGTLTDTQAIAVTVTNINEAPTYSVPGDQSVNVRILLPVTGIAVQDEDNNINSATLTVSDGVLNVSLAGGASISAGQNDSNTMVLSGTQAQINAALATLSYQSVGSFSGSDTLSLSVMDSNGAGQSASVKISVLAADDVRQTTPPNLPANGGGDGTGDDRPPVDIIDQAPVAEAPPESTSDDSFDDLFTDHNEEATPPDEGMLAPVNESNNRSSRQHPSVGADLESILLKQLDDLADPTDMLVARPGDVDLFQPNSASRINIGDSLTLDLGGLRGPQTSDDGPFHISPVQAGKVVTVSVAAGIVWWAGRSVGLLTALMASVPAWRTVDPLPILARDRKRKEQSELENALDPESTALTTQTDRPPPQPGRVLLTDIEH